MDQNKQAKSILRLLKTKSGNFWIEEGKKKNLALFRGAAKRIPAYGDFLKKNNIKPAQIKSWEDFLSIPVMDKTNYLKQYSLKDLCWDGRIDHKALVFAATSGTTGVPFYFPRNDTIDWQSSVFHEMFLRFGKSTHRESTLIIVCFGMGVWIGGVITYEAMQKVGERGHNLSIITPGINKEEIYNAIKNLGDKYDQVVLCGYPPFIKDIVDEADQHGVSWKNLARVKIIFAAETFSEKFRDYIVRKTGIKDLFTDTMNIYGSADLGTMAGETPMSIFVRRLAIHNPRFYATLFPDAGERLPTLVQFNPLFTNIEEVEGTLLLTANNHLPLIRYKIGDKGGVISFEKMTKLLAAEGISLKSVKYTTGTKVIPQLPFVYLYERLDLSTKLYGATIFAEHVREALQDSSLEKYLTGKFTMATRFDQKQNQYLLINIELKSDMHETGELREQVLNCVIQNLLKKNAEYRNNYTSMRDRVIPHLLFWPYRHPDYFKQGIKQKWVAKVKHNEAP